MNRTRTTVALLAALASPSLAQDFYDPDTVRSVNLQFAQANYWTLLTNNYAPEINIAADMTIDGVTYPNVGVRFRGNTSYTMLPSTATKRSFNVELDWMVLGQDFQGYDHLNFNNGYHDPTFLREFLSYMVMRRHGIAPKCNFIKLYLNNQYWGIYINVQQPNKDMMKEWFRSNDGNRYRCFPTSGGFSNGRCCFTWLGTTLATYLSAYQAKQGDGTDLMNMCNVLNNTPTASMQALLPAIFSVDSFYRYAAVMNVLTNTDSYLQSGKDHYLYHDEVHGDFSTFPFDLNEALAGSSTLDPWYQTTVTTRPAFTKTLQFPDWRQRYKAHVRNVVENTVNSTWLVPKAQQYHAMIAADVAADTRKLYSTANFTANMTSTVTVTVGSFPQTIPGLIPLITGRETFLRNHIDLSAPRTVLSNLNHAPARPTPTQAITFQVTASSHAANVKLFWRRVGAFQSTAMFDDGAHGDVGAGDGIWGVILPGQPAGSFIDYYAEATTATGLATYEPFTAELERNCPHIQIDWPQQPGVIRINEVLAQNINGIVDELGQHEDWLELYNDSNAAVDISGMWLSDNLSQLKYQVPAGTVIPAFGTRKYWADEDGTQGATHVNFKLSSSGEAVVLYNAAGTHIVDVIEFGRQDPDVAIGRVVDGSSGWVTLPAPTPDTANRLAACGTRVYESLTRSQHGSDLALSGSPQIGTTPVLQLTSGPIGGLAAISLALAPAVIDLGTFGIPNETLLLDALSLNVLAVPVIDANGQASTGLTIPANNGLVGLAAYAQVLTIAGGAFDTSTALELVICP
ncbi:MAG: CotH kinase family protein [Planctomycetes bacterium]|nr:CotH kinase family protein [Planctomycetota bacterium]